MSRKSTCFSALLLSLFLSFPALAQQLTEVDAKAMLDKLGQASAADEFTLTDQQEQELNSLPPEVRSTVPVASSSPCVLNAGDSRVKSHQFVVCKGILPVGFGPKQSAFDVKFSRAFPWHIVTVDLNTDDTGDPQTKFVQYLWEYDFAGLPQKAQDILKGGAPHPGRSLFRLDGGAWKWSAYQ
ncbi:MAG TPA: hypothetical protein VFE06_17190 [Acidobacteriaceae bacterium]|jgi:hypothetical protein|nr:hypothetical protein [Acidobacteriaceae bacterium]